VPGALVGAFAIVLGVIGGLELFDRTSFALIGLATRARPLPTWAGGAVAFCATTAAAVVAGAALESVLGPAHVAWLRVGGGAFLVAYAAWIYLRGGDEDPVERERDVASAFLAAFLTIFALELGDTTMIFEVVFVADYGWLVVLLGGSVALVSVAAWDVALGHRLGTRVSPERLRLIVSALMLAVGVATIVYGLDPSIVPAALGARPA
jgi:putative Ca2+/H+ antiporter (TMEM165/GDT1 family)